MVKKNAYNKNEIQCLYIRAQFLIQQQGVIYMYYQTDT